VKRAFRFDEVLEAIPSGQARIFERVAQTAAQRGQALYLVGGPVRDLLPRAAHPGSRLLVEDDARALGEAVVRAHPPIELRLESHARFGTLRLGTADAELDVARTRRERYERPGALPKSSRAAWPRTSSAATSAVNALVSRSMPPRRGRLAR
jgi:tRNA nucleotidyltransferase/poly(A) polymerase